MSLRAQSLSDSKIAGISGRTGKDDRQKNSAAAVAGISARPWFGAIASATGSGDFIGQRAGLFSRPVGDAKMEGLLPDEWF